MEEKQEREYKIKESHAQFIFNFLVSRPYSEFIDKNSPANVCLDILKSGLSPIDNQPPVEDN